MGMTVWSKYSFSKFDDHIFRFYMARQGRKDYDFQDRMPKVVVLWHLYLNVHL